MVSRFERFNRFLCVVVCMAINNQLFSASEQPNPLAQLRDIHLPEAVSWWPLAPGWYALLIGLVFTLLVFIIWIWHLYNRGRAKRNALVLLKNYYHQYKRDGNTQRASARVSELLKRVALVYYPRENVASLQGKNWIIFLNAQAKNIDFTHVQDELLVLPYVPSVPERSLNLFFELSTKWIKQRRGPCLN